MKNKSNKNILLISSYIFVISLIISAYLFYKIYYDNLSVNQLHLDTITNNIDTSHLYTKDFIESALIENDSINERIIHFSNLEEFEKSVQIDSEAGKNIRRVYQGRRINIAITGVDTRLGDSYKHADANHVISVLLDSGKIEIISIPRDTYVDCGYDDTTNLNKLTVYRAIKGRKAYLEELARIAELDKIHYYIEFGFSQAIGLIELLGYQNAHSTLKVLRSRVGLGGDDYQRVYNQAQFIRQNIIKNWSMLNSLTGNILIKTGLVLSDNNLNTEIINEIKNELNSRNFINNPDNIKIKVKPPIPINYKIYDLLNPETISVLSKRISEYHIKNHSDTIINSKNISEMIYDKINKYINLYVKNKSNGSYLRRLEIIFEQKGWLQIEDLEIREKLKNKICNLLLDYYTLKKQTNKINMINQYLEIENKKNDSKLEIN